MTGWRLWLTVVVMGVAIGMALGWLTAGGSSPDLNAGGDAEILGQPRPGFALPSLSGESISVDQFDGAPLLVNFWATWCAPCRREMPVLQAASERHEERLVVLGVAMDDSDKVQRFVDEVGVDYTILVGLDDVIDIQRDWGNPAGAMPYTVLVDADGIVRWRHFGEVTASELDEALGEVL